MPNHAGNLQITSTHSLPSIQGSSGDTLLAHSWSNEPPLSDLAGLAITLHQRNRLVRRYAGRPDGLIELTEDEVGVHRLFADRSDMLCGEFEYKTDNQGISIVRYFQDDSREFVDVNGKVTSHLPSHPGMTDEVMHSPEHIVRKFSNRSDGLYSEIVLGQTTTRLFANHNDGLVQEICDAIGTRRVFSNRKDELVGEFEYHADYDGTRVIRLFADHSKTYVDVNGKTCNSSSHSRGIVRDFIHDDHRHRRFRNRSDGLCEEIEWSTAKTSRFKNRSDGLLLAVDYEQAQHGVMRVSRYANGVDSYEMIDGQIKRLSRTASTTDLSVRDILLALRCARNKASLL